MGAIKFRVLCDLRRLDAHLGITCGGCGRHTVYEREGLIQLFHAKNWNSTLEAAGSRFRCRECNHLGATLSVVVRPRPKPVPLPEVLLERPSRGRGRRY